MIRFVYDIIDKASSDGKNYVYIQSSFLELCPGFINQLRNIGFIVVQTYLGTSYIILWEYKFNNVFSMDNELTKLIEQFDINLIKDVIHKRLDNFIQDDIESRKYNIDSKSYQEFFKAINN